MEFSKPDIDLTELEKKAGQKAVRTLRRNFKNLLVSEGINKNGVMHKTATALIKMKYDSLDRIVVKASKVTFIHHYGFEGVKKIR